MYHNIFHTVNAICGHIPNCMSDCSVSSQNFEYFLSSMYSVVNFPMDSFTVLFTLPLPNFTILQLGPDRHDFSDSLPGAHILAPLLEGVGTSFLQLRNLFFFLLFLSVGSKPGFEGHLPSMGCHCH